ncbi:hypothetical protein [Dyella humicola]|uniref:hypothetical protein n=1 Tax=Dyella humicola TaxID=2992126 RepID=UPI0022577126|nr:hypothetical protein [Dyella humicola]
MDAKVSRWEKAKSWLAIEGPWLGYLCLIVLLFAGILLAALHGHIDSKDVVGWLFPLIGTFLGAFLAFRFQELKDRRAEQRRQIDAVNRTLLTIGAQFNHLYAYERGVLAQFVGAGERMLNLPATGLGDSFDVRLATEDLVFLAYQGHAQLLMDLTIEQGRFDCAREVVAARCEMMVQEIQPLIEQHNLNGRMVSSDEVKAAFGERMFGALETATNQVYFHITSTAESLLSTSDKLHAAAKKMFPGVRFMKVSKPPPDEKAPTNAAIEQPGS